CAEPVRLIFVGTGDAEPQLRALANRLDLGETVHFKGFVPREQMPLVYRDADVFALPSEQAGMSIALLEAMASGLPVIVTETGGTAELVTQGQNGEIVPWADVSGLARALQRMMDSNERQRMGQESRRRAVSFGWTALAARYLELCARVALPPVADRRTSRPAPVEVAPNVNKVPRG
ncbi:MAG: glycosyltransferase, partial [Nitrospira sp.]|nr:glycosyltransferase [Nitrospira sp.]